MFEYRYVPDTDVAGYPAILKPDTGYRYPLHPYESKRCVCVPVVHIDCVLYVEVAAVLLLQRLVLLLLHHHHLLHRGGRGGLEHGAALFAQVSEHTGAGAEPEQEILHAKPIILFLKEKQVRYLRNSTESA